MLAHHRRGVNADDDPVGEGLGDDGLGLFVVVGLLIGGHQYGAVEDDEVGIGCRQSIAVVFQAAGHRQGQQPVGSAVEGGERLQLLLQRFEVGVLLILGVFAADVGQRVVGACTHDGVDVAVGIVAPELTVMQPDDAVGM